MEEQQRNRNDSCQERTCECPVGQFFSFVERSLGITDEFKKHIYSSKVEFLKAVRSLIDKKIEDLEARIRAPQKQAEKIEVE